MKQIKYLPINKIVFIDIETVRVSKELEKGTAIEAAWLYKCRYDSEGKTSINNPKILYKKKAALYAEFGKIVCITVGRLKTDKDGNVFPIFKNYDHIEEKELLGAFMHDMNQVCRKDPGTLLFGHAIKGFDMPYIFRRCLINGIEPNELFDIGDAKPWELTAKDTMELWKSGAFYSASLIAISAAFGLPSPKNDISGSEVSDVYWSGEEDSLKKIVQYCMRDVLTLINIFRKCRFEEPFLISEIYDIPEKEVKEKPVRKRSVKQKTN